MVHSWALLLYIVSHLFLAISAQSQPQSFIVRVQNDLKPSAFSDVKQWYSHTLRSLSSNPLASENEPNTIPNGGNDFIHVYKTVFHGFAAELTPEQALKLKSRPGVLAVLPDGIRQVDTTRSTQFLGLSAINPTGLLTESDSGSNVIIGVLDTGIWPERRSFHDDGLSPVPPRWKGECVEGENFTKNHCNKKIIGARYFLEGYNASAGSLNRTTSEVKSARDTEGHGTHTASTAAGRAVGNASFLGFASGVAVGVAPKARIAVYKVCWHAGCSESDILAAFDKAVEDGVDVISISLGGTALPYNIDPIAIGSFGAMERGVLVSASAGNSGPVRMTVANIAPWITTVGASTIDRSFPADLILDDGRVITGSSLYYGDELPSSPLTYGGKNETELSAATCMTNSLAEEIVRGKIVVCERGGNSRAAKGEVVKKAGGVGVVVANVAPLGEGLIADAHLIPGLDVTESAGRTLRHYITSSKSPRAKIVFRGTQVGVKPAPVVASFSSRGPSPQASHLLKPDVVAPGVNVLAGWTDAVSPTELPYDERRTEFNILSGTSMSCPHVSGVATLVKGAHPDWSPAMIRSALMTTAYTHDHDGSPLLDERTYNVSTSWDIGAGHVDPERAVDPGLVYDLAAIDYIDYLCATGYGREAIRQITHKPIRCKVKQHKPWNLNYPAIAVSFDVSNSSDSRVSVVRAATHVSDGASSYRVEVTNPNGAIVTVSPLKMDFTGKGEKQSYTVQISSNRVDVPPGNMVTESGKLTWTNGKNQVVTPVVVIWQRPF